MIIYQQWYSSNSRRLFILSRRMVESWICSQCMTSVQASASVMARHNRWIILILAFVFLQHTASPTSTAKLNRKHLFRRDVHVVVRFRDENLLSWCLEEISEYFRRYLFDELISKHSVNQACTWTYQAQACVLTEFTHRRREGTPHGGHSWPLDGRCKPSEQGSGQENKNWRNLRHIEEGVSGHDPLPPPPKKKSEKYFSGNYPIIRAFFGQISCAKIREFR